MQPKIVSIGITGYAPEADNLPMLENLPAVVYKIPPVVWIIVFLVAGYIGIRSVMED